jgi:hypothetical protein
LNDGHTFLNTYELPIASAWQERRREHMLFVDDSLRKEQCHEPESSFFLNLQQEMLQEKPHTGKRVRYRRGDDTQI